MTHPTLYKIDSKGKVREWRMEVNGDKYRTISGVQNGNQVTTAWTTAVCKNVGSSNEKSPQEQAVLEVESQYTKKLKSKYHETMDTIDQGAHTFEVMLAGRWDKRKDKVDYDATNVYVQPKLDGIRCVLTKDGAMSRTGTPIVSIPHIIEMFKPVFAKYPDAVFDGELYNHLLKDNFSKIVSVIRQVKPTSADLAESVKLAQYHVYDFPTDITAMFSERYAELVRVHEEFKLDDTVQVVSTTQVHSEEEVDDAYGEYLALGYEGGIIRLNAEYTQRRSNNLLKRKDFDDAEFTITRIEEGRGNWAGVAKRVFFTNDLTNDEVGAGMKGSKDYAAHVLKNASSYIGKQVTIQFFGRSQDKIPRFPIAKVLHKDKRW